MLGCIIFDSLYMKCIICTCIRLCLYLEFYLLGVEALVGTQKEEAFFEIGLPLFDSIWPYILYGLVGDY